MYIQLSVSENRIEKVLKLVQSQYMCMRVLLFSFYANSLYRRVGFTLKSKGYFCLYVFEILMF